MALRACPWIAHRDPQLLVLLLCVARCSTGANPSPAHFCAAFRCAVDSGASDVSEACWWRCLPPPHDRPLSIGLRYWLRRAVQQPRSASVLQRYAALGLAALPELEFSTVGQQLAIQMIMGAVAAFQVDREDVGKPLVLLCAGPAGHGKTVLASHFGRVVAGDRFLKIDCSRNRDEMSMFGAAEHFRGGDKGSQLNNFVVEQAAWMAQRGRAGAGSGAHASGHAAASSGDSCPFAVVLLDEFEKSSSEVHNALLNPLESGEWVNARVREGSIVSCSNFVFLLTTNAVDTAINDFFRQHGVPSFADLQQEERIDRLRDALDAHLRPHVERVFGAPMARRIDHVIPFIPFNRLEASAIADQYLFELAVKYERPPNARRHIGNLTLQHQPAVALHLAKAYDSAPASGASAIQQSINKQIKQKLAMQWLQGGINKAHSEPAVAAAGAAGRPQCGRRRERSGAGASAAHGPADR